MSQTVLITGVAGFLGRSIARQFAAQGARLIGVDDVPQENAPIGNLSAFFRMRLPSSDFTGLLRTHRPDVLIHCAGRASVPLSLTEPAEDFASGPVLTFDLLNQLRIESPRCRFVFLSSAALYGNPVALPVRESDAIAPLSPYGFHKWQCEELCREFATVYGLQTASARIFSAYGPGLRRQVVWDICERVILGRPLSLHGTGGESRDFIHGADVARGLALLAEKAPAHGEVYNLATGREVTIADLAALIIRALGAQVEPIFDGTVRAGDPRNWRADISRIAALGFEPQVRIEEGIETFAAWCQAELAGA